MIFVMVFGVTILITLVFLFKQLIQMHNLDKQFHGMSNEILKKLNADVHTQVTYQARNKDELINLLRYDIEVLKTKLARSEAELTLMQTVLKDD